MDTPSPEERLAKIEAALDDQRRLLEAIADGAVMMRQHEIAARAAHAYMRRLASDDAPVLIGPWTGEVGFEVLYWIPFLRWLLGAHGLDPARCIALSRGGVASWYQGLADQYIDGFSCVSLDEWRAGTSDHKKQRHVTPFDQTLRRRALEAAGLRRAHWLHPRLMYRLFLPVWQKGESLSIVEHLTRFSRLTAPDAHGLDLPSDYVAMKWYFSTSFPDTPQARDVIRDTIAAVSERVPVVLLVTGLDLDEHAEFATARGDRVRVVRLDGDPGTNLAVQSAVIARARAFAGTYGGFSYLAPAMGVPTTAFHVNAAGFTRVHLEFAQRLFVGVPFVVLGGAELATLSLVLPGVARA